MSGELWLGQFQAGVETTPGTPVAATRILYGNPDSVLTRSRTPRPHMFMTGTRDNTRALTLGPVEAGGTFRMPLSSSEIIEFLLMGIKGGVTPTTPGGGTTSKQWAFTPGTSLDSATIEWNDGARAWQGTGMRVGSMEIAGSVGAENTFTATLFGQNLATMGGGLTGSLTSRTPDFFEGYETKMYLDSFGGTAGTTAVAGTLINWTIRFNNNMTRKYTANNTLAASATPAGTLECTADFTFEASSSTALSEFNNWENGTASPTKRLVRLEFGNNAILEGAIKSRVMVDLPGSWTTVDLGGNDAGTRTYSFGYTYVFDPTNAFGVKVTCVNNRTAAW
jgi:hypothetical protein